MKKITTISVFLIGITVVFGLEESQWVDYRLVSNREIFLQQGQPFTADPTDPPTEPTCTITGRVCDADCKNVWVCSNNNGEIKPSLIQTCEGDQTCNNGACSDTPSPECSSNGKLAFVCNTEGVFPDPGTCKKYHYCIQTAPGTLTDYPRDCPTHFGYNSGTTYCSKKLNNDHCGADYPVPICTTSGQNAALKENKSIYFLCALYQSTGTVLYPFLHLCPYGQQYDSNYGCK